VYTLMDVWLQFKGHQENCSEYCGLDMSNMKLIETGLNSLSMEMRELDIGDVRARFDGIVS